MSGENAPAPEQASPATGDSAPATDPNQSQTVAASDGPETEQEFSPETLPEKERDRLTKWAEKNAQEFHRKRMNEVGNSLANVPAEHRQALRQRPQLISEMQAEMEALRRALTSGGGGKAAVEPTEPDTSDYEKDARDILKEAGLTGEEPGYATVLRMKAAELKIIDRKLSKYNPERLAEDVQERLTEREVSRQIQEVINSPEFTDTERGEDFEIAFRGMISRAHSLKQPVKPLEFAAKLKAKMWPEAAPATNHTAKTTQKVRASLGDTSNGKVSASSAADPLEQFNERLRKQGGDPRSW